MIHKFNFRSLFPVTYGDKAIEKSSYRNKMKFMDFLPIILYSRDSEISAEFPVLEVENEYRVILNYFCQRVKRSHSVIILYERVFTSLLEYIILCKLKFIKNKTQFQMFISVNYFKIFLS